MSTICQNAFSATIIFISFFFLLYPSCTPIQESQNNVFFLCYLNSELTIVINLHPFTTVLFLIRIIVDEKLDIIFSTVKVTWKHRKDYNSEWEVRLLFTQ